MDESNGEFDELNADLDASDTASATSVEPLSRYNKEVDESDEPSRSNGKPSRGHDGPSLLAARRWIGVEHWLEGGHPATFFSRGSPGW